MEAIKYYLPTNLNESVLSLIKDNTIFTLTDSLGRIEYASNAYCLLVEVQEHRLIGETHKLLKSHLHSSSVYKSLWRTIKMRNKWHGVLTETLNNGKVICLDTTIIPIKDEIENNIKYVALYQDITEQYLRNKDMVATNTKDEDFLKSMPYHVFSITKHGKILNANKSYHQLEVSELIGTYVYDYIKLTSLEDFKTHIDLVFSKKVPNQFEIREADSNEVIKPYTVLISPIFNELGGVFSATVTIQESFKTDIISKEEREAETKCKLIYQSINVGIIVVADSNGNITEWNKGAELAFGYSESDILGKPLTILISKNFRKVTIKELLKVSHKLKNNQNIDLIEMYCLNKDGQEFPVEFALSSLNFRGERIFCAMMLDITNRKALENKLKQKTKDLELFLYRSAHDLKAPFSSAEGLLNLLKDEKTKDRLKILDMLETTISQGKILSDNLAQASLSSISKRVHHKIDFHDIIKNILDVFSFTNKLDLFDIDIDIDAPYTFYSNPDLLNSIFHNLIQNSVKYSIEPNQLHKPYIKISVKTYNDIALIKVRDNGVGMNENDLKNIFDLYYRANKKDIPGNGLGLYVVKNIIEDLEGEIGVKSTLNKGSCFEITLPNPK
ncbi:PAS domain-containing protein [Bizionia arctica]|uniref:histidine kinase n=1 Tax=Bizionia arctica TaxID=1495645 RepID=A0A917GGE9_9FLAO|nr:PAS domain S-box protein [Bizionia arctica]GGG43931.1 hypothetical protein GCM10010976_14410 [Bizionia arctica]